MWLSRVGGGRIDYIWESARAHVYGFSYGFGKGDHAKVAYLIAQSGITVTYDNSNAVYREKSITQKAMRELSRHILHWKSRINKYVVVNALGYKNFRYLC